MSWSDPCTNCGKHRADCDCGDWCGYDKKMAERNKEVQINFSKDYIESIRKRADPVYGFKKPTDTRAVAIAHIIKNFQVSGDGVKEAIEILKTKWPTPEITINMIREFQGVPYIDFENNDVILGKRPPMGLWYDDINQL